MDVTFREVYDKAIEHIEARDNDPGMGMTQPEILSVIEYFDPSVSTSSDTPQSALIIYYYTNSNGKVYGGHVVAAIYEPNNKVRIYNDGFVSTSAIRLYEYFTVVDHTPVEKDGNLCKAYITEIIVFGK